MRTPILLVTLIIFFSTGTGLLGCKVPPRKQGARPELTEEEKKRADAVVAAQSDDPLERLAARLEREVDRDAELDDEDAEEPTAGSGGKPSKHRADPQTPGPLKCPEGAKLFGNPPPTGSSQYCAKPTTFGGGKKHGPYVKWDDSGTKRYEATFFDDVLDGEAISYGANGEVNERQEFQKGVRTGHWEKWNREGLKIAEGSFSDGKKDGHFRYWNRHGDPVSEGNFRNEIKTGVWIFYDRNGVIRSKFTFRDGKKDGKSQSFYATGRVESSGTFRANKPDGLWTYYSEEGRQTEQGTFVDGKKSGKWTQFDPYGRVAGYRIFNGGRIAKGETQADSGPKKQSGFQNM